MEEDKNNKRALIFDLSSRIQNLELQRIQFVALLATFALSLIIATLQIDKIAARWAFNLSILSFLLVILFGGIKFLSITRKNINIFSGNMKELPALVPHEKFKEEPETTGYMPELLFILILVGLFLLAVGYGIDLSSN